MIKRIDPKAVTKVVSISDDAIDKEKLTKEMASEYAESADISKLPFIAGKVPTFFLVQNIGARKQAEFKQKYYRIVPPSIDTNGKIIPATVEYTDQTEMLLEYFETCVKQVEEDGKVSPISLDEINFYSVQEIGGYAMLLAAMGESVKKN